jgi:hypothetical protein
MATKFFDPMPSVNPEDIYSLQVTANTTVKAVNQMHEKVVDLDSKIDHVLQDVKEKQTEKHETMEELGTALTVIGKSLTDLNKKKQDKPIPDSFLRATPHLSILSPLLPVYNPSGSSPKTKFSVFFPPESSQPESSKKSPDDPLAMVSIHKPSHEQIPPHSHRPAAPDLVGKGKVSEGLSYADEWYQEWNLDNLSVAQIRQVIDRMFVSYKIMCMKGKGEVEACKSIIQCFTGSLSKWWEITSSPIMLSKMESETLKDEQGDIVYHADGTPMSNMIGALTTLILEHWCGTEKEISDKHEIVLMNMKCRKMSEYE